MDVENDNGVRRDGGARERFSRAPVVLSSDAGPHLRAAFDVRPRTIKASRVAVPAPDWFSTSLHDPGVRNLARTLDADHTLSRTDMMAVFREVEGGGA